MVAQVVRYTTLCTITHLKTLIAYSNSNEVTCKSVVGADLAYIPKLFTWISPPLLISLYQKKGRDLRRGQNFRTALTFKDPPKTGWCNCATKSRMNLFMSKSSAYSETCRWFKINPVWNSLETRRKQRSYALIIQDYGQGSTRKLQIIESKRAVCLLALSIRQREENYFQFQWAEYTVTLQDVRSHNNAWEEKPILDSSKENFMHTPKKGGGGKIWR